MPSLLETTDQRIIHHGTWEQFKLIQKGFDGSPGVRLFYYDETIEILMPGQDHEMFSRIICYLLMTFLTERGVFFQPTGSMTQEREGVVSAQADESYCIGSLKLSTRDLADLIGWVRPLRNRALCSYDFLLKGSEDLDYAVVPCAIHRFRGA